MKEFNVAIDGPAGAGKSTIAKIVSKKLGIIYLDTGAMYRAVALEAISNGIGTSDREKLAEMVKNINIAIEYSGQEQHVFLNNIDVSSRIRTPEISVGASNVSAIPEVRIKMVEIQREIARSKSVVMDGRDIGTYVLPEAAFKFFLTADIDVRAKRRFLELSAKGTDLTLEDVKKDIEYRDKNDSTRAFAPLCKAKDAVEIDTTYMTIDEVAERILSRIHSIR